MKTIILSMLAIIGFVSLHAQSDLRIESTPREGGEGYVDIRLQFDSNASSRYLVEQSEDLSNWEPHSLAPFEYSAEGYWVRQLDSSNLYSPNNEFYRVSRLPWLFETIVDADDWIGDVVLTLSENSALLVYQNRDSNELYFTKSDSNGSFASPTVIANTGAVDQPGFWDNSGFSEVTIAHFDGRTFIGCTDSIEKKVIILWKDDLSTIWHRHDVSDIIESHYWAFPKFTISDSGILGIAYRVSSGTVFSFAEHTTPRDWTLVNVTGSAPNSSAAMDLAFSSDTEAHVYIRNGGSYKISTETSTVTSEPFPTPESIDLTEEENQKIQSTHRNETLNHVRLSDDRILIVLSNGRRIVAAVEEN